MKTALLAQGLGKRKNSQMEQDLCFLEVPESKRTWYENGTSHTGERKGGE